MTAEKYEMKCEIKGERQLQNPTHCITFTTNEQGKKDEGFDESGECCWAGTHESWVPKHLRNIVEVKEDGKMFAFRINAKFKIFLFFNFFHFLKC